MNSLEAFCASLEIIARDFTYQYTDEIVALCAANNYRSLPVFDQPLFHSHSLSVDQRTVAVSEYVLADGPLTVACGATPWTPVHLAGRSFALPSCAEVNASHAFATVVSTQT